MKNKYKCFYEITGRIEDVATFLVPIADLPKEQNLSCKSTQARLAASWGYVKAEPLTDEQIDAIDAEVAKSGYCQMKFARAIEESHGIKE